MNFFVKLISRNFCLKAVKQKNPNFSHCLLEKLATLLYKTDKREGKVVIAPTTAAVESDSDKKRVQSLKSSIIHLLITWRVLVRSSLGWLLDHQPTTFIPVSSDNYSI